MSPSPTSRRNFRVNYKFHSSRSRLPPSTMHLRPCEELQSHAMSAYSVLQRRSSPPSPKATALSTSSSSAPDTSTTCPDHRRRRSSTTALHGSTEQSSSIRRSMCAVNCDNRIAPPPSLPPPRLDRFGETVTAGESIAVPHLRRAVFARLRFSLACKFFFSLRGSTEGDLSLHDAG